MALLTHSPLTLFIVQAVIIIAVARLIGLLARYVRQPMVIAEVVAGIVLGPSLLGWLAPDFFLAVFPDASMPVLNLLAQVGLLFFMFLIGLELDPKLLRGHGRASMVISYASILAPFGLGALLALYLHPILGGVGVPFSSFALFLGAAMSITAFPVLARILAERRMLKSKLGILTITCAAVNDVTAWCILAFVVSIARADGVMSALWTTGMAALYIGVMVVVVRPFLGRLSARGSTPLGLTQNIVAVTFLLLLISAWVTELIGIHALFGAFLLGSIIPKENGFAQTLGEKVEDLVVVFLLPLFFAYTGLRTQFGLLNTPEMWGYCLLIILVAVLGKFGGSALAARFTGMSWRESGALGILMNTRGLMELIVLNIGLDLGVISPTVFAMMVIMAVVTTFITTPLLHLLYRGNELAEELQETMETAPVSHAGESFSVLMCVSYDASGPGMVTLAGALVETAPASSRLYALRLIPPTERTSFYLKGEQEREAAAGLGPLVERGKALKMVVRPLAFVSSNPADDICNVASVKGVDLILLGWHRPLLSQVALGGTVHNVMTQARSTVGVLIDRGLDQIRQVLVPYHGGIHDLAALTLARRVSRRTGAKVTILHVLSPDHQEGEGRLGVRKLVAETFPGSSPEGSPVSVRVVHHDNPTQAALEESFNGYDLVIIGVGQEWGLEHRQFGIQPETIIQSCPASLLVVRQFEPDLVAPFLHSEPAGKEVHVVAS